MRDRAKRGLALITVLLFIVPLVMMLTAALRLVGHGTFTSLTYQDRMEAFYAAEAGVVFALEQLETQGAGYTPGDVQHDLPNGRSSFQFGFGPSVNNLGGGGAVSGPRGSATVPADSVDLIVTGRSGAAERKVEVIIKRRGSIDIDNAVFGGGRIRANGNVSIVGVKDIYDYTRVDAGMHSNYDPDVAGVIQYDGAGASLTNGIYGDVTTVSHNSAAIAVTGGGSVYGESLTGQPKRPIKDYDVMGIIAKHSGGSAVPPIDPATGVVTLSGGDYYHSGDLTIVGEIDLDGSNLYVRGKLDVQGGIKGIGSVYAGGDTRIRGDSSLRYSSFEGATAGDIDPDEGVGLFSAGDIRLEGYDGEQYLEDHVLGGASSPVRKAWEDSKKALDLMDDILEDSRWDGMNATDKANFDAYRRVLGQDTAYPGPLPSWASGQEQLRVVVDAVATQPPSPEQRFLLKKLNETADTFDAAASFYPGTGMTAKRAAVQNFLASGDFRGAVDSALDIHYDGTPDPLDDAFKIAALHVQQLNVKGMGHSYFQGVVYTEGSLHVTTSLQIVGGVIANGDPAGSSFPAPGDIYLENGASILFPRDQFRGSRGVGGTGQLGVTAWIPR